MAELVITKNRKRLQELEIKIDNNLPAFVLIGECLHEIKGDALWETAGIYKDWPDYLRKRFGFGQSRANQYMISYTKSVPVLEKMGNILSDTGNTSFRKKLTADHITKIATLDVDKAVEVLHEAFEDDKLTQKGIKEIRDRKLGVKPAVGIRQAHEAIDCLREIPKDDPEYDIAVQMMESMIADMKIK